MSTHCSYLSIALVILSVNLAGCRSDKVSSIGSTKQQASITNSTSGLFVIDGTNNNPDSNTVISRLEKRWNGKIFSYQPGVGGPLGTAFAIGALKINRDILQTQICPAIVSGNADKVFLAGYSRGAIMALGLAIDIWEKNKCGKKPKGLWLGMLDAVDISMWTWDKKVPAGDEVSSIHIVKKLTDPRNKGEFNWSTKEIDNVTERVVWNDPNINHLELGDSAEVLETLIRSAKRAGGSFTN